MEMKTKTKTKTGEQREENYYIKLRELIAAKEKRDDEITKKNKTPKMTKPETKPKHKSELGLGLELEGNEDTSEEKEQPAFVKLREMLEDVENKTYQMIYNEETKQFNLNQISGGLEENIKHHCGLMFKMQGYDIMCVTYVIPECEKNDEYLKIIGLLFTRNGKTHWSFDIVKSESSDCAQLLLSKYDTSDRDGNGSEDGEKDGKVVEQEVIGKIEKFPAKKKVIEYLLNLLSDDRIRKIYD